MLFLLAMLGLWTLIWVVLLGGMTFRPEAIFYAVLTGLFFGYWATGVIAAFDWISRQVAHGLLSTALFLALVAGAGLAAYFYFSADVQLLNKNPMRGKHLYAAVTMAIAACYLVRNIMRAVRPQSS
jgi:hypothetical protein